MMAARNPQTTLSAGSAQPRYPFSRVIMAWLLAYIASSLINYLILILARSAMGIESNFGAFGFWPSILIINGLYLLAGALVFWFIAQRVEDVRRSWDIAALVGLVLSLIPNVAGLLGYLPDGLGAVTVAPMMVLMVMHLVSYAIAVGFFPRFAKA